LTMSSEKPTESVVPDREEKTGGAKEGSAAER